MPGYLDAAGNLVRQLVGESSLPPLRILDMDTVSPIPGVRQAYVPRYEGDVDPAALRRMANRRRTLTRDVERGLESEAHRWYHAEPIRQQFISELGDKAGNEQYNLFASMVAGTSSAAPVRENIRKASWYRQQALAGRLPAGELDRYDDAQKWIKANKPPEGYGSVAQINDAMWASRFLDGPQAWRSARAGAPHKIISFEQNLRGNLAPWTGDRHEAARLGVQPVWNRRSQAFEKGQLTPNEYVAAEQMIRKMAGSLGLQPAEFQSARWMGGSAATGVKSADPTFPHAFEAVVDLQAARTGRTPQEVMREFIRNGGLLSAAAVAALSEDELIERLGR